MRDGYAALCYGCHKSKYDVLGPKRKARNAAIYRRDWKFRAIEAAKKRGVKCTITSDDLIIPERCPVLDIPLTIGTRGMSPNSPTLDRIDPTFGYVRGNVAVISWRANRIKGDQTDPAVFEQIAAYMRNAGRAVRSRAPHVAAPKEINP